MAMHEQKGHEFEGGAWGNPLVPIVALFLFVVPFFLVPGMFNFADLPKRAALQLCAVLMLGIMLAGCFTARSFRLVVDRSTVLGLSFMAWAFCSLLYAGNRYDGLQVAMHWAACFAVFFVLQNSVRAARDADLVFAFLFAAGCGVALLGIAQHLFGFSWIPQVAPPAATFANKNMAAEFLVLIWPLGLCPLLGACSRLRLWVMTAMAVTILLFLLYAKSKAAWVAVGIETSLLAFFLVREGRRPGHSLSWSSQKTTAAAMALLLIILLGVAGWDGHKGPVKRDMSDPEYMASGRIRVILWSNALAMIRDHPLAGVGAGNFEVAYPLYHRKGIVDTQYGEVLTPRNVHNDYLQVLAELGLIGSGLLALFLAVLGRRLFSLNGSASPPPVRQRAIVLTTAMGGGAVSVFFAFPMQLAMPPFILLVLLGVAAGLWAAWRNQSGIAISRLALLPTVVLVLVAAAFLGRYHYQGFRAGRHYFNAIQLSEAGQWPAVITEGRKALDLFSGYGMVHSYVGFALFRQGRYQEAAVEFDRALAYYPNSVIVLRNSGTAHYRAGNPEFAAVRLAHYNRIKPDNSFIHELLASAYRDLGNMEAAFAALLAAADLVPENGQRYIEVGKLALENGQAQAAGRAFEKAARLRPEWGLASYHLGAFLYQRPETRLAARTFLQKALQAGLPRPEAEEARRILAASPPE